MPVVNRFNINNEIPRSASHDLGIFIFPEFLAVMVVCRLTPLGYADFKPKSQEDAWRHRRN